MNTSPSPNLVQATPIIHTLAVTSLSTDKHVIFDYDVWPKVARELIREGYTWPALQKLAAASDAEDISDITPEVSASIEKLVPELIQQTGADTPWPYWDMICAIIARQWSIEEASEGTAGVWAYGSLMDTMWYTLRGIPQDEQTVGVKLIWRGMGLSELVGFQDITKEMVEVLREAQAIDIPVPFDALTCKTILEGTY